MKKTLIKTLSILLLGAAISGVSAVNPTIEANAAWKQDNTGWWYTEGNSYVKSAWRYLDGKWYYFDSTGYMKTGWLLYGSDWYYLDASGAMQTGWVKYGQDWYYMNSTGAMHTGWLKEGENTWYYLDSCNGGRMSANLWNYEGYYFNASGVWDGSATYLRKDVFNESGTAKTKNGLTLYQAGDQSPLQVINGEPCMFSMSNNVIYMIGLNTLTVYDTNNTAVDKVVL